MQEPILEISKKQYTEESTVVSVRLPKDMLRDFDDLARQTNRTRNELLLVSLEFALNHIKLKDTNEE